MIPQPLMPAAWAPHTEQTRCAHPQPCRVSVHHWCHRAFSQDGSQVWGSSPVPRDPLESLAINYLAHRCQIAIIQHSSPLWALNSAACNLLRVKQVLLLTVTTWRLGVTCVKVAWLGSLQSDCKNHLCKERTAGSGRAVRSGEAGFSLGLWPSGATSPGVILPGLSLMQEGLHWVGGLEHKVCIPYSCPTVLGEGLPPRRKGLP